MFRLIRYFSVAALVVILGVLSLILIWPYVSGP